MTLKEIKIRIVDLQDYIKGNTLSKEQKSFVLDTLLLNLSIYKMLGGK